ncbi:MAG: hypothetical protein JSS82_16655 [Bacteroidetes bacterium]|nr:hypothetical protein [Bacteroidota bacterium]
MATQKSLRKYIKREVLSLHFGILSSDYVKYAQVSDEINKLVNNGQDVPAKLLVTWFEFLQPYDVVNREFNRKQNERLLKSKAAEIDACVAESYAFFTKTKRDAKEYDKSVSIDLFEPIFTVPGADAHTIENGGQEILKHVAEFSLKKMLRACIEQYFIHGTKLSSTIESVVFFYKRVKQYFALYNSHKENFSFYQTVVIAGYFTAKVAKKPLFSAPKSFTGKSINKDIFDATNKVLLKEGIKKGGA